MAKARKTVITKPLVTPKAIARTKPGDIQADMCYADCPACAACDCTECTPSCFMERVRAGGKISQKNAIRTVKGR